MSIRTSGGGFPRRLTRPLMLPLFKLVPAAMYPAGVATSATATAPTPTGSTPAVSEASITGSASNRGGTAFATAMLAARNTGRGSGRAAGCCSGSCGAGEGVGSGSSETARAELSSLPPTDSIRPLRFWMMIATRDARMPSNTRNVSFCSTVGLWLLIENGRQPGPPHSPPVRRTIHQTKASSLTRPFTLSLFNLFTAPFPSPSSFPSLWSIVSSHALVLLALGDLLYYPNFYSRPD